MLSTGGERKSGLQIDYNYCSLAAKTKAHLWQNASAAKMKVQTAHQLLMTHGAPTDNMSHVSFSDL